MEPTPSAVGSGNIVAECVISTPVFGMRLHQGDDPKPLFNRHLSSMNEKHAVEITDVILNTEIMSAWQTSNAGISAWLDKPH